MGFVVMPDHVHVAFVLCGQEPRTHAEARDFWARSALARVMNSFKGCTGKKINELLCRHGDVWQPAYYDHLVRDQKDFRSRLNSMHANPTRKGLVRFESEYEFSTAHPKYQRLVDSNWLFAVKPLAPERALLR